MHDARDERGALSRALGELAVREADGLPPFDFDEFLRRADRRDARAAAAASPPAPPSFASRRAGLLRVAAVLAPVAVLAVLALALRSPGQREEVPAAGHDALFDVPGSAEPALVNVAAAGDRVQLEDHIALVDALLNEAAVEGRPEHERAALLAGRHSLTESLQRVRYAESLLATY